MGLMGGSAGLNLGFMVYTGARLGADASGALYAALFLVFLLCTSLSAVNGTVTRYTSLFLARDAPQNATALRRQVARWLLLVSAATVVAYLIAGPTVERALRFPSRLVLPLVLAVFLTNVWLAVGRGTLRGTQRFSAYGWTFMLEALPRVALMVPLLHLWTRPAAAMGAYWAGTAAATTASLWWSGRAPASAPPTPDYSRTEIRNYLILLVLMVATLAAFSNADMLLARRFFTGPLVGAYGAAATLAKGVEVVTMTVTALMLPVLTATFARGEPLARPFLRLLVQFAAMAAVPLSGFLLVPAPFLRLLYGPSFVAGAPYLWPHGISALLTGLTNLLCQVYNAAGKFSFLPLLVAGLAAEVTAATLHHPDLRTMLWVVCTAKAATLCAVAAPMLASRRVGVR